MAFRRILFIMITALLLCLFGCKTNKVVICINKNLPIQTQFKKVNTTYIIQDLVDLNGGSFSIPENSTLKFKRNGKLKNGVIRGNNTLIEGCPKFDNVRFRGMFKNQEYRTSWCSQNSMSDYIEDVMNLSDSSVLIVDCDITLNDKKKWVNHLTLIGENKTITNSDRFYVTYGSTEISNLKFRWVKAPVIEPTDNYDAVVIYYDMLLKDTTVVTRIENVDADGGRYCSYFMRQYKSGIEPKLRTINTIQGCNFRNFTMGAIWTCGGSGKVCSSNFTDIGYEKSSKLRGVTALRLGYVHTSHEAKAIGYVVKDCLFRNIVAVYNPENDGRGLHGLLAYGDSIVVKNNTFSTLSTSFSKSTDTGMDSEMLYIKGSYNIIEGNTFENGAGEASDGVITLKIGSTEGNVVRNNQFLTTNNASKFIYLSGRNHIIEGNSFVNTYSLFKEKYAFAIYLGHREKEGVDESVIIHNNSFSFTGRANYMAVFANRWGDVVLSNNTFQNPTVLIKYDKRFGTATIQGNHITLDNVKGKPQDAVIMVSGDNGQQVAVINNAFSITNSVTGKLVNGSNYCFYDNIITLKNSTLQALLRGADSRIEVLNNSFSIDNVTTISNNAVVGEVESSKTWVENNVIIGRQIDQQLKKKKNN